MLLTHDKDFWDDRRFPPDRNPGVVILPGGSGDESALFEALRMLHSVIAPFGTSFPATKISISSDGVLTTKSRDGKTGAMWLRHAVPSRSRGTWRNGRTTEEQVITFEIIDSLEPLLPKRSKRL
jgi:hypothetical protein